MEMQRESMLSVSAVTSGSAHTQPLALRLTAVDAGTLPASGAISSVRPRAPTILTSAYLLFAMEAPLGDDASDILASAFALGSPSTSGTRNQTLSTSEGHNNCSTQTLAFTITGP